MEERRERLDSLFEERVDEPVVEVEARVVDAATSVREHARPGDREPERVEAELAHELHVVAVAVVEVACDLAGVAAADLAGRRGEAIPDALASAVSIGRSLDLVRRSCRAPDEVGGEGAVGLGRHECPLD